jgi:hypothetical protein
MRESILSDLNAEIQLGLQSIARKHVSEQRSRILLLKGMQKHIVESNVSTAAELDCCIAGLACLTKKVSIPYGLLSLNLIACYYWTPESTENWARRVSSFLMETTQDDYGSGKELIAKQIEVICSIPYSQKLVFLQDLNFELIQSFTSESSSSDFKAMLYHGLKLVSFKEKVPANFSEKLLTQYSCSINSTVNFRLSDFNRILPKPGTRTIPIRIIDYEGIGLSVFGFVVSIKDKCFYVELGLSTEESENFSLLTCICNVVCLSLASGIQFVPMPLCLANNYLTKINQGVLDQIRKAYMKYISYFSGGEREQNE